MKLLALLDKAIDCSSRHLLVLSVFSLLFFSLAGIVLRWWNMPLPWIDPLTRHLVFLSAFLGGCVAVGSGRHITIDILERHLESAGKHRQIKILGCFLPLATSLILLWPAFSSLAFIRMELTYGKEVFWGIHSGFLAALIPLGFSLMAYRFFFLSLHSFFANRNT